MTTKISSYVIQQAVLNQITTSVPKITAVSYIGDDTATSTSGGQTVTVTGTGFQAGATVYLDNTPASPVTVVSSTQITFTAPAKATGSYILYVCNSDGGSAIYVPGVQYSGTPTWATTAGSQGSYYETNAVNNTFVATGDAPISYSFVSGSLPAGTTFNPVAGVLNGTAPADSGSTTYTFTIRATDAQNQDTDRTFSLTINTDVVTWSAPTNGFTSNIYEYATLSNINLSATSAAGKTISYAANSLPTGITLSGSVISGAPTTVANTVSNITATAATTNRTSNVSLNFNVLQDVVTWNSPADGTAYSAGQNIAITPVTLSATSAAGFSINYAANALPAGVSLTGGTISGTPTTLGSTVTQITANASTSNRSATPRVITWTVSLSMDNLWKYNTLLLSANAATQTSSFVADNSLNNTQLTVAGDTRASNFNPYQHGYYSNYFNGSTDYLNIAANAIFSIPTNTTPFTIEGWFYLTSSSVQQYAFSESYTGSGAVNLYAGFNNGGTGASVDTAGLYPVLGYYNGTSWVSTAVASSAVTTFRWYHIAWVFAGNTAYIFVNGVNVTAAGAATTWGGTLSSNGDGWYIARRWDTGGASGNYYAGYISNFRFVKGLALYTAAFTPSTTPLTAGPSTYLLTCQSAIIRDSSPSNIALVPSGAPVTSLNTPFPTIYQVGTQYYSTVFNGSTDYLQVPASGAFSFTGDFTIEAWVYLNSTSGGPYSICGTGTGAANFDLRYYSNAWQTSLNAGGGTTFGASAVVVASTWNHIAMVRSGSSIKLYVNGVNLGSTLTNSSTLGGSGTVFNIGASDTTPGNKMNGAISNLRIVNGQALYTANFTPSTSPLTSTSVGSTGAGAATSITGTVSLLTCQDSTSKDNSSNAFAVTSAGSTKPTAVSPLTPAYYSNYFDGSSYIYSPNINLASNNFTIEGWFYATTVANLTNFWGMDNATGTNPKMLMYINSSGALTIDMGNAGTTQFPVSATVATYLPANAWNHIALVRSGLGAGQVALYINGVSVSTGQIGTNLNTITNNFNIGYIGEAYGQKFSGYISNFRVVNGQSLYTANFTPATTPLTTTSQGATAGNVSLLTCQSLYFNDNSPNVFTITQNGSPKIAALAPFTQPSAYSSTAVTTYGSGYFDGTGDNITVGTSPAVTVYSGLNFTIEAWVYMTANPTAYGGYYNASVCGTMPNAGNSGFEFTMGNGTTSAAYNYLVWTPKSGTALTATYTFSLNQWYHIAVSRSGSGTNNVKIFINGIQYAQGTYTTFTDNSPLTIGSLPASSYYNYFPGYISDLRIVKTGLYTANFQPNFTAPLTAVTNTQLLTLQTRGAHNTTSSVIDNSNFNNIVTRFGDTNNGTFSPYGNNYSVYFDGSSYLNISSAQGASLFGAIAGTQITIEFWVMTTTIQGITAYTSSIFGQGPAAAQNGRYTVNLQGTSSTSTQTVVFWYTTGTGSAVSVTTTAAITQNTWNHIAITIDATTSASSTIKIFVNGTGQTFTAQNLSTHTADPGNTWMLGAANDSNQAHTGYISNFRFTRGYLVYTANFTPPTAPLITNSNAATKLLTAQSSRLVDNSSNNVTFTLTGTPQVQKFSPFSTVTVPTYYSGSFNGSTDYLTAPSNAAFQLGTGDFTIELWVYVTSIVKTSFIDMRNGTTNTAGIAMYMESTGVLYLYVSGANVITGATLSTNNWYHIALVRSSGSTKYYLNGVQTGSTYTDSTNYILNSPYIGRFSDTASGYMPGYISNLRIVKGQALYTSAFTPSTSPLTTTSQGATAANVSLLTLQNNTFIDNSPNYFAITAATTTVKPLAYSPPFIPAYYSNYFGTTSDYISVPIASFPYSGTTWTMEGWFCPGTVSGTVGFFCSPDLLECKYSGTTFSVIYRNNSASPTWTTLTGTITLSASTWYHIAISTSAGSMRLFINGVQYGSTTSVVAGVWGGTGTNSVIIGANDSYTFGSIDSTLAGYVSNFRITNTAVYTAAFTPPTSPLTAISGTTLLTCQSGYFADGSTNYYAVTLTGSPKIAAVAPFTQPSYATGSMSYSPATFGGSIYYDGTGDYVQSTVIAPGTGDFTIEGWVYPTANPAASSCNIMSIVAASSSTGFQVYYSTSGWGVRSNTAGIITAAGTVVLNTWFHVAMVRKSGTITLYLNGVSIGTTATAYTFSDTQFNSGYTSIGQNMTGYVSDIRYTPGVALYSAAFFPGVTPLTNTATLGITNYSASMLLSGTSGGVIDASRTVDLETLGDAKVTPFSPYNGTYYSNYFSGTTDYLTVASNAAFAFTGAFTVEAWFNWTTIPSAGQITGVLTAGGFNITYNTTLQFNLYGTGAIASATFNPVAGTWYHIAMTRDDSNNCTVWLNGVSVATGTSSASFVQGPWTLYGGSNNGGAGYVSNLRITKGQALYTTTFTPSTIPLTTTSQGATANNVSLLTCQSNKFVDNSTNAFAITAAGTSKVQTQNPWQLNSGISYYFDGTGDRLALQTGNPNLAFGSGDFTVEAWVYVSASGSQAILLGQADLATVAGSSYVFYVGGASTSDLYVGGTTYSITSPGPALNTWAHVAWVRNGTSYKSYLNGVQVGTTTLAAGATINVGTATYPPTIGGTALAGTQLNGYIADLRVTKGSARYTAAFTPTSTPLLSY